MQHICCKCGTNLPFNEPFINKNNNIYCGDCAFLEGFITADTLKKVFYYFIPFDLVGNPIIKNGHIKFVSNSYIKAKTNNDFRRTPEYIKWRKAVYERDDYTCQICGKRGGTLNAHHIKHFAKNKDLRTDINNGITLCEDCHKAIHRGTICEDI